MGTPDPLDAVQDPLVGAGLKTGATQLALLCARNNADAVSKAFCASATPPAITSLADLQKQLGLDFKAGQTGNGTGGNPAFVLTGHSSSLVTRFINAINPRAIIFTPPKSTGRVNNPQPLTTFTAMGFARGEQFVELVSNDPVTNDLGVLPAALREGVQRDRRGLCAIRHLDPRGRDRVHELLALSGHRHQEHGLRLSPVPPDRRADGYMSTACRSSRTRGATSSAITARTAR